MKERDDFLGQKKIRVGDLPSNTEQTVSPQLSNVPNLVLKNSSSYPQEWYQLEVRSKRSHVSGRILLSFVYTLDDVCGVPSSLFWTTSYSSVFFSSHFILLLLFVCAMVKLLTD